MNLYEIITLNILIIMGYARNIAEALNYIGPAKECSNRLAHKVQLSFQRSIIHKKDKMERERLLKEKDPDMDMAFKNLPIEKQGSLKMLKKLCTAKEAAICVWDLYSFPDGVSLKSEMEFLDRFRRQFRQHDVAELTAQEIISIYEIFEPVLLIINVPFNRKDVVDAFRALVAEKQDENDRNRHNSDACRKCPGPHSGISCLNELSPCYLYQCGMYPGTGQEFMEK